MIKKRSVIIFLSLLLVTSFLLSIVSAQGNVEVRMVKPGEPASFGKSVSDFMTSVAEAINPIAKQVLGDSTSVAGIDAGEVLFAKILFFVLILLVIVNVISRIDLFGNAPWVSWVIAAAVSILATRWIVAGWVSAILLPYTTLGIAIAAGLPFVIYFFVVETGFKGRRYKTFRRIAWIFFSVIFLVLYLTRTDIPNEARWVYGLTIILSIAVLLFDGTIQNVFKKMNAERIMDYKDLERKHAMMDELDKLKDLHVNAVKRGEKVGIVNDLSKRIKYLEGEIKKLP